MAIILYLVATQMGIFHQNSSVPWGQEFEKALARDLEKFVSLNDNERAIIDLGATRDHLEFPWASYFIERNRLVRFSQDSGMREFGDAYLVRFSYYIDGRPIILPISPQDRLSWNTLQVVVRVAEKTEDANFFINDGVGGIDLDGRPENGTARLKSVNFHVP